MTATTTHQDRIAVDPDAVHSVPRIRGTRVTVQLMPTRVERATVGSSEENRL